MHAKQTLFCSVTDFISVILPGIDFSSDSTKDLRGVITDSSLPDWKRGFTFILFGGALKPVLHSQVLTRFVVLVVHLSPTLCFLQFCVPFYPHRIQQFDFFKKNFFTA